MTITSPIQGTTNLTGIEAYLSQSESARQPLQPTFSTKQENSSESKDQVPSYTDRITLSQEGLELSAQQNQTTTEETSVEDEENLDKEQSSASQQSEDSDTVSGELTQEEQEIVEELSARDREVRTHEQAHKNVGGQYAGAISYDYENGPDGNRYAVGGEVPIDVSEEDSPEATLQKMEIIRRAALAPKDPSGADRSVAAEATAKAAEARHEIQEQKFTQVTGENSEQTSTNGQNNVNDTEVTSTDEETAEKQALNFSVTA